MSDTAADLIDAKIAASEARTDAKFIELRRMIATLSTDLAHQRMETRSARTVIVGTTIGTGLTVLAAVIGALVAMLSYGAATFYNGTVIRDVVRAEVAERLGPSPLDQKR